jgi:excinuclease ABC subunit A
MISLFVPFPNQKSQIKNQQFPRPLPFPFPPLHFARMSKSSATPAIRLRGVRHNNLKNFDLDLPLHRLIVITGVSGSGKSSLAFDTLFAEGQRRYIETFSPYARQFFDRMDKPQVDTIEGIPPAIAIEQRNSVKTTRSTVGTMTEICDYMKLLWPQIARLHCRQCAKPVTKESPQQIWETLSRETREIAHALQPALAPIGGEGGRRPGEGEFLITFSVPISEKLSLDESLALIAKQGYQRLLVNGRIIRIEEARTLDFGNRTLNFVVVQDRVKLSPANRARFVEACEQAYHFGKGKLALFDAGNKPHLYSNRLHCARCDIEYREPSPALFSFNHPVGACPTCRGFGRTITIDYNLALPDHSKTLAEGVVKPWQTGQSAECKADMLKFCKIRKAPTNVPFQDLPKKWQDWVVNGDPDYGKDSAHEWPRAWYGIKGYFRWLESKSYKMHVRVLLSRYRAYIPCPSCHGKRFQPDSLLYRVPLSPGPRVSDPQHVRQREELENSSTGPALESGLTLADFYQLPIRDALAYVNQLAATHKAKPTDPLGLVLNEVRARLGFLDNVGLGYLTLDRPTRSLSGGETERVNLTTCLGTRLVNTLFVLDEPSVGLHPRDTARLVRILEQLRNAGNSVVVVEHEAAVMRAADQIVDIGPGHGAAGGHVVFQGPFKDVLKSADSLTGQYLAGRKRIEIPARRKVNLRSSDKLSLAHATLHNLKDLSIEIPLSRLVCISGVSGSGKSTLIREILMPMLTSRLGSTDSDEATPEVDPDAEESVLHDAPQDNTPALAGWQSLGHAILVDQSILAKTPRSNPAVYTGAFDFIRELFASSEIAKQRGFNASAFSFNSGQGQCERCRGAGFEKIEMQFLSDVFIRCPECNGRRYRPHILEIKIASPRHREAKAGPNSTIHNLQSAFGAWSVGDFLDATVDDAIVFLSGFSDSRHAQRALSALKLLQEVGLGYLQLGQPINTLSGGESQRLKLVRHLAESVAAVYDPRKHPNNDDAGNSQPPPHPKPTLFLFDEPTTGLHFDDVRVLLKVFQRLVDAGHSVVIIEHNLDVIKSADWVIDLGPDAGDQGGEIVAQGTPEQIAACAKNHTGQALKEVLG